MTEMLAIAWNKDGGYLLAAVVIVIFLIPVAAIVITWIVDGLRRK